MYGVVTADKKEPGVVVTYPGEVQKMNHASPNTLKPTASPLTVLSSNATPFYRIEKMPCGKYSCFSFSSKMTTAHPTEEVARLEGLRIALLDERVMDVLMFLCSCGAWAAETSVYAAWRNADANGRAEMVEAMVEESDQTFDVRLTPFAVSYAVDAIAARNDEEATCAACAFGSWAREQIAEAGL